ncbi:MAG: histidine kinase, partial [Bacteroidia bacterium]|nr:histidine kinase [Bacteroidia bacterium]
LLMLLAVYTILEQKKRITYWFFVVLGLSTIVFTFFSPKIGWILFVIISSFLNVDITFVSFIAIKNKKRGAWIIALGAVIFIICWSIFLLQFYQIFNYPSNLFYLIAVLSIPVAFAIFLSFDFGLVNKELQQKFIENEKLSEEKQQILSTQNETLEKQVTERTAELNQSLNVLKTTQAQLIQSEKLASLGELTAGIAHEIQNPLNFVNNFAEVSAEMLDEMHEELEKGDTTEAIAIATDLKTNLEKINHHGQRASAIVKGMLEHSRTSTGTKVATNLNALADEYLRLAYHGLRAKDSSFNATMETHFDPELPKIEVIPQDIGRVLLNLINNAFYAVNQRNSTVETLHATSLPYQPTVTITTKKLENAIEISVKDNGNGIPENIKDKIFQPFFTTKPTGQGTGLGLSLAYDIVTKGHGGTLTVSSIPGTETTFEIQLPINEANH